jgi:hypothetical protein
MPLGDGERGLELKMSVRSWRVSFRYHYRDKEKLDSFKKKKKKKKEIDV